MKKRKAFNLVLTTALSLWFLLLGFITFRLSYLRLGEAFRDLGVSVQYYFCELFGIEHSIVPSVTDFSRVLRPAPTTPQDFGGFKESSQSFFSLLFSAENFGSWAYATGFALVNFLNALSILLPCAVIAWLIIKRVYKKPNTNHNQDTKPLKAFKRLSKKTFIPIKNSIRDYIAFVKKHSWIWKAWIALWVLNLNLASIAVAALAYYFYFAMSFNIGSLYVQIVKLFTDLGIFFKAIPWGCWVIVGWLLFCRFRVKIALMRLRHMEAKNCGFINALPIVSITCGSMGKKKTTAITDMTLSQELMFRQKAEKILQQNDMKFPYFPWICFEKELQKCMEYGTVYNLATTKKWVQKKRLRFERHGNTALQLYGYNGEKYGMEYDDCLKISNLFEVLETYAQAYFIFVIQSSLIVSNYSVRTDNALLDEGNFPAWYSDFFPKHHTKHSRHAKVLDFDVLRLGKKVLDNNPNIGSFEFGVVSISEIGKERGNNLELQEVKKKTEDANQKNDLFNSWLKMCRHSATVDNFPFIKVFTDEQRPESWGADARDLCEVVRITDSSDAKLTLPFYTVEDMLSEAVFNWFIRLYYDFRFRRGDNTLLMYLLKKAAAWIFRRNMRIYNRFGFSSLCIEKERGTMDGRAVKKAYYLMHRKIYARRFSTDCFSDYFNDLAKKTKVGLNDYREYATEKADISELQAQNSYFINSLYKG
ncbi:MAG: hypothetical protein FWH03_00860 [Firmicutes bacterium]|nr:hypothetical protein [Bacillota bacterium]